ncbi:MULTISPECIES: ABC transporter permease [unclassified Clostridium]|uniref:ABC transporter permease n=1 Tax=unclassified Clostridium TaxID=2614128 RepID=UPI0002980AC8|nr:MULTISPECIES: ABC transporter permease [unclassified Clostridium]EKQ55393.1 MAG: ABC-type multidrug transport system, permease component [Clostridium sp. Maddingley MBC34-26]
MRVKAIMVRILLQLAHDKRTIGLMIMAPILVLTLMSFIFDGSDYHPKIGIVNAPISLVNKLEDKDVVVIRYTENDAYDALKSSKIDALINFENGIPKITLEGSDPSKSQASIKLIQGATQQLTSNLKLDITYLYGYENMTSFDNFGPILIGFFVFFFVFLVAGVSFLGERTSGTLERILATPLRRWEIVLGYVLGFGVFTIIQSALIAWYSISILNIMMIGSFSLVILITILTAMVALTIGTFISAFANNELQMIQFIPIIVVPQVFFSGLFDLSTMSPWLQSLGHFMPLWYSADALRNIMIRGKGWNDIAFDVLILILICVFFMILNILALKKYRKI